MVSWLFNYPAIKNILEVYIRELIIQFVDWRNFINWLFFNWMYDSNGSYSFTSEYQFN